MHIEILVEDVSGKRAIEALLPGILGDLHTYNIHAYKGIGRIPRNMKDASDPSKRILLENLPKLLKGYGRTFQGYGPGYDGAVVIVCDLDDRNAVTFTDELKAILGQCNPKPKARFYFAIEESEAWLLGDLDAVRAAYPNADDGILESYVNDRICGTWELLADAVFPGGSKALIRKGWQAVGAEKSKWAEKITPHMDVEVNASPSFRVFRDGVRSLGAPRSEQP